MTARLVRLADHRRLQHGWVLEQTALDVKRPDSISGRRDHIVRASDKTECAILALLDHIASQIIITHPILPFASGVAGEEEQWRLTANNRQDAFFSN